MGGKRGTPEERFWRFVERTESCWLWTGTKLRAGYGSLSVSNAPPVRALAHRLSWQIHHGEIPDGMHVLHRCDNPSCVRPDHLFLGTHRDNMLDKVSKGRANAPRGERVWGAKLTPEQVREARAAYRAGTRVADLARKYGVSHPSMTKAVRGERWRYVS